MENRTRRTENRLFELKEEYSKKAVSPKNSLLKVKSISSKASLSVMRKNDSSKDHLLTVKNTDSASSAFSRTSSAISSKISGNRVVLSPRNRPVKELMKKQKKLYSPLQDDRNIKKCQIWRFPIEEIERILLNGKITYRYKTTGYDIFCPACNLFFKKKDDYQVHLMILQQVEPIKEEIRDTIRYMKDYLSQKAHELKPLHERYPRLLACAKARSERITKKLVTFSKSLEHLQNCYDHQQQVDGDKQLNKWPKKKPAEDIGRNQPKRWFNAVVAMRKMKDAKDRLIEIRRKRAYREAYRQKDEASKVVESLVFSKIPSRYSISRPSTSMSHAQNAQSSVPSSPRVKSASSSPRNTILSKKYSAMSKDGKAKIKLTDAE